MKAKSFIVYFHRYGEADWVVKVRGQKARLTCAIRFVGRFTGQVGTKIRKRQPRAVIAGRAVVKYSRDVTLIVGA